jgi:HD superfamily phosphohydrolase
MGYRRKYWNYKSVRDPLYGFINLSKREALLIGTPFMHRLTRIKQLAHTYLVYPSAVHTRFEHALGALFMADRMCQCFEIEDERREIIRCAALLHDVGHGPFSHVFENIMVKVNDTEFTHEDVTCAIIKQDHKIHSILEGK